MDKKFLSEIFNTFFGWNFLSILEIDQLESYLFSITFFKAPFR